jgi:hypothetical protein
MATSTVIAEGQHYIVRSLLEGEVMRMYYNMGNVSRNGYLVESHRSPSARLGAEDNLSICGAMARWRKIWSR